MRILIFAAFRRVNVDRARIHFGGRHETASARRGPHSASQARIDRPVDKRRASHPLPQAAFSLLHSSGSPALRRPSITRAHRSTERGSVC
jgi:hypothetical protein